MTFDGVSNLIAVQTNDATHVGVYPLEAKISLVNYPAVSILANFEVEISLCIVVDFQQQPLPAQAYNIYTPTMTFGTTYWTMTPMCGYTLEYQIRIKDPVTSNYSPLPAWLQNTNDLDFSVQTDDPLNEAQYMISIVGSVPTSIMNPTYTEELIIILNVNNFCRIDTVIPLSTIPNQLYYIAEDGVVSFAPTW